MNPQPAKDKFILNQHGKASNKKLTQSQNCLYIVEF